MSSIKDYSTLYDELMENEEYRKDIIVLKDEWELNIDNIVDYLPKPNDVNVTVGVTNRKTYNIKNFQCIDLSDTMQHKKGFVLNTGGAIWGLDFVPQRANDIQYLSLGGYNSTTEHHTFKEKSNTQPNAIQIWKWSFQERPQLDACILHSMGVVVDMKWCPLNFFEHNKMIGVLAVLLNTGKLAIFVVPHPDVIRQEQKLEKESPVFLKVKRPRLLLDLPRNETTCFAWNSHGLLASGTAEGNIIVWDVLQSIVSKKPVLVVNICNPIAKPIRVVSWRSLLDKHTLLTSDVDGSIRLYDLRDPYIPFDITRIRSFYACIAGTGHGSGFIYADGESIVRGAPGYDSKNKLTLTVHNCHVWDITVSPHHGIMASVSSDGYAKIKPFANDDKKYTLKNKSPEYTLYILEYYRDINTLQYIDGIPPTTNIPSRDPLAVLMDPIRSLNKVKWNPNKSASGWIASGGTAGLCRLEYSGLQNR